jgi:hypothetical protein
MDRIHHPTVAGSAPAPDAHPTSGFPTAGNPLSGQPATVLTAWTVHMLIEELRGVVVAGGLVPDKTSTVQLLAALRALFAGGMQVFTASGTFTVPAGITSVEALVIGGGGAGGASGGAGNAGAGGHGGGMAWGRYAVTPGAAIAVTVGAGGEPSAGNGGNGGTSSLGALLSATGGQGGLHGASTNTQSGTPGAGTGGQLNITGGIGGPTNSTAWSASLSASGPVARGGAAPGGLSIISMFSTGDPGGGYGAGGNGASGGSNVPGGAGAPGLVLVRW